jgi:hypothetical protein
MVSLSNHGGQAFTLVLRQAQDDSPLHLLLRQTVNTKSSGSKWRMSSSTNDCPHFTYIKPKFSVRSCKLLLGKSSALYWSDSCSNLWSFALFGADEFFSRLSIAFFKRACTAASDDEQV